MSLGTTRRLLTTIDAHAGGEPLRLVTAGIPPLHGRTILERRAEMLERHDHLRRVLMWEPRGHADMYGAILTPPVTEHADYGVLFMHNEGYSTMCGHGIIALTTVLLETGMHPAAGDQTRIGYDTPAGFVAARAQLSGGRVLEVAFENVASFVYADALQFRLSHGTYRVPVVFGGAFYALAEAGMVALDTRPEYVPHLVEFGMDVKHALDAQHDIVHPLESGLRGIYGTILTDDEPPAGADGRNVTVFADGEVDRSPCGTGTAGRLAWLFKRGQLGIGEPYVHEGVTGTRFTGRVLRETTVGPYPAIVPEIAGRGFLTGMHTFVVEPDDPTAEGFLVR